MPVEVVRRDGGKKYSGRRARAVAAAVLTALKSNDAELSVALVGNREIQKLNWQYRKKDYATDVLSFPAEGGLPPALHLLGDVVISVDKASEQAREHGRTLDQEMVTLLIHGIVHLHGYDHEVSAKDARIMTRLEKKIHRALCDQGIIAV